MKEYPWMQIARSKLGIHEIPGPGAEAFIVECLKSTLAGPTIGLTPPPGGVPNRIAAGGVRPQLGPLGIGWNGAGAVMMSSAPVVVILERGEDVAARSWKIGRQRG
jgi:hypothetical protein